MICSCGECYACGLRAKGVALSNKATPNRAANRPPVVRPMIDPSWEKGIVGEKRVDGSFMPVLNPQTGQPLRIKERADLGSKVTKGLNDVRSAPAPQNA